MKQERDVLVIARTPMASTSPVAAVASVSPVAATSLAQQPFPTPSPFSFSVASTRWSSRPSIHFPNLVLRFLTLVFSFASAVSLASASSPKKKGLQPSSFTRHPELIFKSHVVPSMHPYWLKGIFAVSQLSRGYNSDHTSRVFDLRLSFCRYCFIIDILAFVYSSFQLFKGICDIAHRGILIPDMISDYISFILDQLVCYLLISSSSVAIPVIQDIEQIAPLRRAAVVSTSMSFATFLVIASCTLFSGYKLCKRIIW